MKITEQLLLGAIAFPFLTAITLAVFRKCQEKTISLISSAGILGGFALTAITILHWLATKTPAVELYLGDLYRRGSLHFPIVFILDKTSAVFLGVTSLLGALIVKYCRYYLHREEGYARFFITIFFFLGGMRVLLCAGTLEILFAGWEVVGIASFLLIGFYRDRALPQRNALRAFTVYRLCDIGLVLGAWIGHMVWHESRGFLELAQISPDVMAQLGLLPLVGFSFLLLLAASGKSAQFPFCFWLPRAMEGPTPSSAIFYGALSVHAGVFLLMRTMPIWGALTLTRAMVGSLGLLTAVVATLFGRVQSNIKAQVGYASIAQVGIMLFELSLGLTNLALFHFTANAMLRCYQLLVSPSVVAHLLRVQSASANGIQLSDWSLERKWIPQRWRSTVYAYAFNEGYLEPAVRAVAWQPLRKAGKKIIGVVQQIPTAVFAGTTLLVLGYIFLYPEVRIAPLTYLFSLLMLLSSLAAFGDGENPLRGWNAIALSTLFASATVSATGSHGLGDVVIYLSGIAPSWIMGSLALRSLTGGKPRTLGTFHGLGRVNPVATFFLFLATLGIVGFPISPAFVGEDLLLHHAAGGEIWIVFGLITAFVLNGISAVRLFARLGLGPRETAEIQEFTAH